MIDLSDIVTDSIFTVECVLIRRNRLRLPNGRDEITTTRKTIQAVLQPLTDAQLMNIPETTDSPVTQGLSYWGIESVTVGDETHASDQIEFMGVIYDVVSLADFNPNGNYYNATLVRSAAA